MGRDVEGHRPEVDLPVRVDAGDDEEDAGPLGAALAQATQAEDDGTLVLLDHLYKYKNIVNLVTVSSRKCYYHPNSQ